MTDLLIIASAAGSRRWERALHARLVAAGHQVSVQHAPEPEPAVFGFGALLALEQKRLGPSLASPDMPLLLEDLGSFDLVIDLTNRASPQDKPTLTLEFGGQKSFPAGIATMLANPELTVRLDGALVSRARPMLGDRLWLSRASNYLLAGAISLIVQTVDRFSVGPLTPLPEVARTTAVGRFWLHYPPALAKGIAGRILQKIARGRRPFYWQVAYRRIAGPGVAKTGALSGTSFRLLPDDGERFYADPFILEDGGRTYLFVEEFPYASARGVISVAELNDNGQFDTPRVVLSEPHHLSYPQVFAHDGDIFMLPESAAARELVLYRANRFPDEWVRDTVLLANSDINDATLLESGGRFWLFATERFGHGSPSDTMVVYSAPALRGPWGPHPRNPIMIDHSAARPGGAFIRQENALFLPVQNGSRSYGGGLGLARLDRLDETAVEFSEPRPIRRGAALSRKGIHTLNRVGDIEVVDSAG